MFHIILHHPEIPPNTGNVIRLCANTGSQLHLVRPLGFDLDDRQLRRAGLDYHEYANVQVHDDLDAALRALPPETRVFAFSTKGGRSYADVQYQSGDAFLFGAESRGLPVETLERFAPESRLRLPMLPHSRSLNLSNAVAVVVFEGWRQNQFDGS
ncbi:MAG: tRNA (uridine(34)/cytosine(34)/5-carboxymethylaminomethyluridine(34)-2'-O)-methyltransferase TrmL [Gallionellaceae bacterium]|nr:tRNA (uridine(34)/cytosine(34)/5-carboxymethylaminomethyluridine(34)-2'-O)-methyltransferase TrmL [Gallionellaceae bacterium]